MPERSSRRVSECDSRIRWKNVDFSHEIIIIENISLKVFELLRWNFSICSHNGDALGREEVETRNTGVKMTCKLQITMKVGGIVDHFLCRIREDSQREQRSKGGKSSEFIYDSNKLFNLSIFPSIDLVYVPSSPLLRVQFFGFFIDIHVVRPFANYSIFSLSSWNVN